MVDFHVLPQTAIPGPQADAPAALRDAVAPGAISRPESYNPDDAVQVRDGPRGSEDLSHDELRARRAEEEARRTRSAFESIVAKIRYDRASNQVYIDIIDERDGRLIGTQPSEGLVRHLQEYYERQTSPEE